MCGGGLRRRKRETLGERGGEEGIGGGRFLGSAS